MHLYSTTYRTNIHKAAFARTRGAFAALTATLTLAALTLTAGCKPSAESDDAGLLGALGLAGLSSPVPYTLTFVPRAGSATTVCSQNGSPALYTIAGSAAATLQDLRMYVHNVRLVKTDGSEVPLSLTNDGTWQYQNVALLDFEDATGNCNGTSETNTTLRGTAPRGTYASVRFTIGVPESLNHSDVSAADTPAPLNVSGMNWSWAVGRKFLRFEILNGANTAVFHLGAQSCTGTPPNVTCARSGRPEIEVPLTSSRTVTMDLQNLFGHANWDISAGSASCHANPGSPAQCPDIFPRLGLDWADASADAASQTVFGAL